MWEFDDAVDVHTVAVDGIETPDQFLWRGRLWRVCSTESRWTEAAVWWERGIIGDPRATHFEHRAHPSGVAAPAKTSTTARSRSTETHSSTQPATHTAAHTAGAALASAGSVTSDRCTAAGVLDADWGPQRTVYRVQAGCGRHGRRELFDLAHDPDSNRWQLERVTDR